MTFERPKVATQPPKSSGGSLFTARGFATECLTDRDPDEFSALPAGLPKAERERTGPAPDEPCRFRRGHL